MRINGEIYREGIKALSFRDPDIRRICLEYGLPPLWQRPPGFATLVHIILEQQVSLASANAAFNRLLETAAPLTPEKFLEFDDSELKVIGFSRQKTRYCRELARAIHEGQLDLDKLETLENDSVREALTRITGIGPWTAEIYLLMALARQDAWPSGDLALASAVQTAKQLPSLPDSQALERLGNDYRPYRAVAARIYWHFYLSRKENGK